MPAKLLSKKSSLELPCEQTSSIYSKANLLKVP